MATTNIKLDTKINYVAYAIAWVLVKLYLRVRKIPLLKFYHNEYPIAKVAIGDILKLRFKNNFEVQATEYKVITQQKDQP